MRAVNLIPAEERRGAGGIAGRSGGVAYVLTGALAVIVVLGVVYALAVHSVAHKNGQLAAVTEQVSSVSSQADSLAPYVQVAALSAAKVQEVTTLAKSRFNWPGAMRQLALGLPSDVTLTTFGATVGSSATLNAAGLPATDFNLSGCASNQAEVATVLTDLAGIPGVDDVTLTSTIEQKRALGKSKPSAVEAISGSCPLVTFNVTVEYDASYTVPDSKIASASGNGHGASGPDEPVIKTAASQQLSRRIAMRANDRLVVAVIAALVLIAGMWLLVVSPERGKVTTLSGQISSEQTALQQAQAQLDSARQSVAAYVGHVDQIDSVMRAVPTTPAVASLIKTIVKLAGTKVDFHSLGVGSENGTVAGPNAISLNFAFSSNYGDLQSFLAALDALTVTDGPNIAADGRLFTVQTVSLSPDPPDSTTATIVATVYTQNAADGSTGATGATGAVTP